MDLSAYSMSSHNHVANRRQIHGAKENGCKKKQRYVPLSQFLCLTLHPNRNMARYLLKKDELQIRMNRKSLSLLSCLIFWAVLSFAQNRIGYTYDAAGNRVRREIVLAVPQARASQRALAVASRKFTDVMQGHTVKISTDAAGGVLNVCILGLQSTDRCSLAVCTYQGMILLTEKIRGEVATVNISRQPAGVYLFRITLNDHAITWKIVKK
mgnify:CR=1 FL=1